MVTNLADLVKATFSTALFKGSLHASVRVDTLACRYPLNKAVLDVASTKSARFVQHLVCHLGSVVLSSK